MIENDKKVKQKLSELKLNCKFYFQPVKLPNFNVLDLGIFNCLKKKLSKEEMNRKYELVINLQKGFDKLDINIFNNIF